MKTRSTTILAVRRNGVTAMAGDGQVTIGSTVVKAKATKIRTLQEGRVLVGIAGSAADALALFQRFESKLEEFNGNLRRAAVELAKDWRTERALRRLEAMMVAADVESLLLVSGTGDLVEPDEGIVSIGSGEGFARAAATALMRHTDLSAKEIAREALLIASSICIYTNDHIAVESVGA
ncbi:MAG: HslU--HslV peptidase proteolytic subunit [Armatimonadetes bacterium CG_4_10_14_3_um_filter_66_18]|nr:ATP-dependent protease subunit HslV [Armatimonadota bacterium]OIO95580.1 MAG: HslU--HslV peptidase proteolytic subunit [Armatimonadetes bacterium CG2_30_66_41]PIU95127.1 MAG: HslU--HslV peptidase proteolytic subunit [Armatimonadetes bacterium CG06_land_8_20_14_3_00_66_21]PIW14816.1 MAG: HslU--HslV peptidase proteolytic subunit [Armatimonadetes bacterium CG17_big_fil_post_rev_8_21_14_2_50_66_6]PIX41436.1 MAG: HslU--HslV peptidase proteolytic subunit [Armatimonadetes bacterium CG_4_8_14_3_um_f